MTFSIPFLFLQVSLLSIWWLLWFLYPSMNNWVKALIGCAFVIALVGWGIRAYQHYWPYLVVSAQSAPLYIGPERSYPQRGILKQGESVAIEQKKEGWYYVLSSQGRGWVEENSFR